MSHTVCMTHGEKLSTCVAHYMHDTWCEDEQVCRTLYARYYCRLGGEGVTFVLGVGEVGVLIECDLI